MGDEGDVGQERKGRGDGTRSPKLRWEAGSPFLIPPGSRGLHLKQQGACLFPDCSLHRPFLQTRGQLHWNEHLRSESVGLRHMQGQG